MEIWLYFIQGVSITTRDFHLDMVESVPSLSYKCRMMFYACNTPIQGNYHDLECSRDVQFVDGTGRILPLQLWTFSVCYSFRLDESDLPEINIEEKTKTKRKNLSARKGRIICNMDSLLLPHKSRSHCKIYQEMKKPSPRDEEEDAFLL